MGGNDLVLTDQLVEDRRINGEVQLSFDVAFEHFACEQALHGYGLSAEEVTAGVIGGGDDGGLDGVYVFLGNRLLHEDSDVFQSSFSVNSLENGAPLTLWLVQAKTSKSFSEVALDKVASSCNLLLNLDANDKDLSNLFSQELIARISLFRKTLLRIAKRMPAVKIRFSYVTRGDTEAIHPKVRVKAQHLETQFAKILGTASGEVEFLGPAELWKRASVIPSYTLELPYQESITHGTSHIALITLGDYLSFLSEDDGSIKSHIFDWNVRDYQGNVEVNREIAASLQDPDAPEFWWLNNGITIVCSGASSIGKRLSLSDVQIVNGLQTSYTLHNTLRDKYEDDPEAPVFARLVQVRILVTGNQAARDAVIRATNRQTTVPVASLRATDDIQRQIESYFYDRGWFYDRRKNYYRNQGKPLDRIISIPFLAQTVMAMALGRPDYARARPSSLLKSDSDYERVFSSATPLPVYLWLAKAQRHVDAFLQSSATPASGSEFTNLHFYLAMLAATDIVGQPFNRPAHLENAAREDVFPGQARLVELWGQLRDEFRRYQKRHGVGPDQAAKNNEFVQHLLESFGWPRSHRK
ncbi:AIPR family protein [Streptomyces sp. GMY01]|uniref:AIPR family protein n=1 Tax=Streptomyces sp. GMY02 TaxID=1333528 RepID=UPI00146B19DB|nr:AIPR family protein [Streptomyces sp. GMY02]NMO32884.1 AIPR family protein [Streptomyces sp. GMY02]